MPPNGLGNKTAHRPNQDPLELVALVPFCGTIHLNKYSIQAPTILKALRHVTKLVRMLPALSLNMLPIDMAIVN
jgi:hypothetical protein